MDFPHVIKSPDFGVFELFRFQVEEMRSEAKSLRCALSHNAQAFNAGFPRFIQIPFWLVFDHTTESRPQIWGGQIH